MNTLKNILITIGIIIAVIFIILLVIGVKIASVVFAYIFGGIEVIAIIGFIIYYIGKASGRRSKE